MSSTIADTGVVEIDVKIKNAKGMDRLTASVAKLKGAVAPAASSVTSLSKALSGLNAIAGGFKARAGHVAELAAGFERLGSVSLGGLGKELRQIGAAAEAVNGVTLSSTGPEGSGGQTGLSMEQKGVDEYISAMTDVKELVAGTVTSMQSYMDDMGQFTDIMGEFADESQRFAGQMEIKLGVDSAQAMESMGFFQQMVTGFGVTSDRAYILSKNLTQLGYDLASFSQSSVEETFAGLQAGMAGSEGALQSMGVDLSGARLQQELYALGVQQTTDRLSQSDQALLRYIAIMNQTRDAQASMGQSLREPADALYLLQAQLAIAWRWIGAMFIPAISNMISWVIAFVKAVGQIAASVAKAFGFELKMPEPKMPAAGGGIGAVADQIDAVDESAKQAKKDVDYLLGGFDELNVINKNVESPGAATGAPAPAGDVLGDIQLPEYNMFEGLAESGIDEKVKALKGPLEEILKLAAGVYAAFLMWKIAPTLISGIKAMLGVLSSLGTLAKGISFANLQTAFTGSLKAVWGFASGLGPAIGAAGPVVAGIAATIGIMVWRFLDLYQNSESFRTGLSRAWELILLVKDAVGEVLNYFKELAVKAGQWALNLLPEGVREAVLTALGKIKDFISGMDLGLGDFGITAVGFGLLFTPAMPFGIALLVFEGITLAIRALGSVSEETWGVMKSLVSGWLSSTIDSIKGFVDSLKEGWSNISTVVSEAWGGIVSFFTEALPLWWEETIAPWFTFERWQELFGSIKDALAEKWGKLTEYWGTVLTDWWENDVKKWFTFEQWAALFENIVTPFLEKVTGIVEYWRTVIGEWWENDVKKWFTYEQWAELCESIVTAFSEKVAGVVTYWRTVIGEWWENDVKKWFTFDQWAELFGSIITAFSEKVTGIVTFWRTTITGWWESDVQKWFTVEQWTALFKNIITSFTTKIEEISTRWNTTISTWWETDVKKWFSVSTWLQLGKDAVDGLFQGIGDLFEKGKELGGKLISGIRSKDGIDSHSPSIAFYNVGVDAKAGLENAFDDVYGIGQNVGAQLTDGLRDGAEGITLEAAGIAQSVQKVFGGVSYRLDTDYTGLRNKAIEAGAMDDARELEEARRAKIQGEGLSYALDDDMSRMLQGTGTDLSNEALASINEQALLGNEADAVYYEESQLQLQTILDDFKAMILTALSDWTQVFNQFAAVWRIEIQNIKASISTAASRIVASTDRIRINVYNNYYSGGDKKKYASGGFPEHGEVFIANEAGPELVGSIGSRTAVVNQDQIVASVSAGVAEAVGKAMSQSGGQNRTVIELDGEVIYDNQKKIEKRRGYNFNLGAFAR